MDSSSTLRGIAVEVHDLLTEYIKISDRRLKEFGTFLSIFKKKDYKRLNEEATIIYLKTRVKQNEINGLKDSRFFEGLSQDQKEFFVKLAQYIEALTKTTFLLSETAGLEYKRSQNMINISLNEFMNKQKEYKEAQINCQNIGVQLQRLVAQLDYDDAP